jgi:hypothetical protein
MKLVADELMVASVSGWNGREREGEKKLQKLGVGLGFWPTLDPISFISGHEIQIYL